MLSHSSIAMGERAAAALDRALAQRPQQDGEAFAEATVALCELRDVVIDDERRGRSVAGRLGRLNGVISSTLTGHFPLGKPDWTVVETARSALGALLDEGRATPVS